MALLLVALLAMGMLMVDIDKTAPLKRDIYSLHKSLGVLLFILVVFRISMRFLKAPPTHADGLKPWEIIASQIGHAGLYLCMLTMPLSGMVMSFYYGVGVQFFSIALPNPLPVNIERAKMAGEVHEIAGLIFIVLIIVHVAAVIKHRLCDKINLLPRMW